MDTEAVKDKIKKLLALSQDNPSDAESYAAMSKAQELMAKFKLEKSDITDDEKEECISTKTTISFGTRSSDHYLNDLAAIIANNFCCVNYVSTKRGSRTHYICFMGMKDDVAIAEEVFYAANTHIIRGYNRVYKEVCKEYELGYLPAKYFNPIKTGYVDGYLDGLKEALDRQKEQNQEWGLVLVVPQEAKDFIGGLNIQDFSGSVQLTDRTYYDMGYEDGNNFQTHKKLGETKMMEG